MRAGLPDTPTIPDFLAKTLPKGSAVGIDPFVHSIDSAKALRKALEEVGCSLVGLEVPNPVDVVWGEERPAQPNGAVWLHGVRFAGETAQEKIGKLREQMKEKGCDHVLFSMLDEVCWLFNIRGDDIPHCPVVMSYALVSKEEARLYVDKEKLGEFVEEALVKEGVTVLPYEQVLGDVGGIAARESEKIWLDPSSTSQALSDAAAEAGVRETTPVQMAKACKNEAELRGMREAHLKDGVALSSFLCWVENYVSSGENTISEVDAAAKLREFRAAQEGFLATSFGTIAGSGPNGAIIHYSPTPGECGYISNKDVLLLDSGGQYEDGTTDVTRTMHLGGSATEHEKECYTRVLQGHIAIDNAVFPEDTTGLMLDSLARMPLWSIGLDYRHGTGHGVGACLNVHEGPQSISPRLGSNRAGLKAGMILSNEPGYYEDGNFGVRIENLLIVVKKNTAHEFGGKDFLGFERLTHAPMDTRMIMTNLLSDSEVRWVNTYHEDVWQKLSPRMEDGQYKEWLWEKTRPLPEWSSSNPATSRQSSVTRAGV
ncbi:unnamed protein product [Chondrus crispus]|uniref:Uncharacterized protein n=1 Tax=Chondrus crispus TaxID=2769 RepID=R7QIF4_CHOCR|nr:unnamed protein product [Chondrus crispus]CDF37200.1 unnamed protein product [Chondrus crispus]|eukprot:XP_005717019.1 unnamed protein product [Chondrus crispus]